MTAAIVTDLPRTALAFRTAPPAPAWPNVEYDGETWRITYAFKTMFGWVLSLRTGKRYPITVPARLCRWSE